MAKKKIGIGLIGSGFMGRTHALGFAVAARVFDLPFDVDLAVLADVDEPRAAAAARQLGFRRSTANWRELLDDPEIDVVDITTPNTLHREMALAAIAAGKHVYCEKPLAPTAAEAAEMAEAAARAGVVTQVGFNYLKNPMIALAKRLIERARSARSGPSAASTPRTTWPTPTRPGRGDSTPRAAAGRWPTSAATSWRRPGTSSARSRR